jgi:hypothetical protein
MEEHRLDSFSKTISTQLSLYKSLINKDRSQRSEGIVLNNSMNRLLAAEAISQELYPRSNFLLTDHER